ncbi:hypothetical protein B296_00054180 [Ensete ventricosum]|uniref:Uncharacterized protein n=1 Tax=Ensete ventricosum TaxID=4639 RepID=A0A426XH82_ENSVE|nr:hypothetical protein B296_00054180 [Ensete ventricosum]
MGGMYRADKIPVRRPPAIKQYRRNRHLPACEQGDASSPRTGMRCHLVFQQENEASPCPLAEDEASFSREARRRCMLDVYREVCSLHTARYRVSYCTEINWYAGIDRYDEPWSKILESVSDF